MICMDFKRFCPSGRYCLCKWLFWSYMMTTFLLMSGFKIDPFFASSRNFPSPLYTQLNYRFHTKIVLVCLSLLAILYYYHALP